MRPLLTDLLENSLVTPASNLTPYVRRDEGQHFDRKLLSAGKEVKGARAREWLLTGSPGRRCPSC